MLNTCEFFVHENRYPRWVPLAAVLSRQCLQNQFRNGTRALASEDAVQWHPKI